MKLTPQMGWIAYFLSHRLILYGIVVPFILFGIVACHTLVANHFAIAAPGPSGPSTDPEMFGYILTELHLVIDTDHAYPVGYMNIIPLVSSDCLPQVWGEEPPECPIFGCFITWYGFPMSLYLSDKYNRATLVWGYPCDYIERQRQMDSLPTTSLLTGTGG